MRNASSSKRVRRAYYLIYKQSNEETREIDHERPSR